jgi:MYXO-CTERM domain-containing protein
MKRSMIWLATMILLGCAAPAGVGDEEQALGGAIDPNDLLIDAALTGGQTITAAQMQTFLASKGSALASYKDPNFGNQSAAQLIVSQSQASQINPVYLLARIQTESSLIESGSLANLGAATGCACPDSGGCNPNLSGFGTQVQCAAQAIRGYLTDLATKGYTVSGWRVGVAKTTSDGCSVTPADASTAALYTYTPWVGAYSSASCGDSSVGGSTLVAVEYARYAPSFVSSDVCSREFAGSGFYCGAALSGPAGELFHCVDYATLSMTACPCGCTQAASGHPDFCTTACADLGAPPDQAEAPADAAEPPPVDAAASPDLSPRACAGASCGPLPPLPQPAVGCSLGAGRADAPLGFGAAAIGLALLALYRRRKVSSR